MSKRYQKSNLIWESCKSFESGFTGFRGFFNWELWLAWCVPQHENLFFIIHFSHWRLIVILPNSPLAFRRCDHRSDETLFQGYKFHLNTKSKRRRYRSSWKSCNTLLNQDLQDFEDFLSGGHQLRWCAQQLMSYFFIIHFFTSGINSPFAK